LDGLFGGGLALITFAEAFSCEEEDLGVFHQAIGDGGSDGGVVEDVASENAVLMVMRVLRLWLWRVEMT
jgi:hypothetical protein